jgi:hypothetical protein
MIVYLFIVVLVSIYVTIVVYGHVLLVSESTRNAFNGRSVRYLDAYRCSDWTQSGGTTLRRRSCDS